MHRERASFARALSSLRNAGALSHRISLYGNFAEPTRTPTTGLSRGQAASSDGLSADFQQFARYFTLHRPIPPTRTSSKYQLWLSVVTQRRYAPTPSVVSSRSRHLAARMRSSAIFCRGCAWCRWCGTVADATEKMRMAMHDWDLSALRADNDLRAYIHAQLKPVSIPSSATPRSAGPARTSLR